MVKTVESQSDTPVTRRLVVRVKIPVEAEPPAPARQPLNKGALALVAVAVVVALSWLGIRMFRSDPESAPAVTEVAPTSQPQPSAPAPTPPPQPAAKTTEVVPDVPQSALDTVRGTIVVIVRVTVDQDGTVTATSTDVPGPSRYFARLATEAARKWTFAPTDSAEQRSVRLRFNFARDGATASALPQPNSQR